MEHASKRPKVSETAAIADIATSIGSLAGSIKTLGALHSSLLQANKAVVAYVQETKSKGNQSQSEAVAGAANNRKSICEEMTDTKKKMQADEYSRAISFANGYFALVDGLAYGLEDHLVEDVRLEWFGRVIKGRKNVAAFMKNHMANSSHMFTEIIPITNIVSGIREVPRRKSKLEGNLTDTAGNITENIADSDLSLSSLRIEDEAANKNKALNFDLKVGDVKPFFPDETTQNRSEVGIKISKMEEDCVLDNHASVFDKGFIKFVESKGIVRFDRRCAPNKIYKWGPTTFKSLETPHQWRRRCILKVAYSPRFQLSTKSEENLTKATIFGEETTASVAMDCEQNKKRDCSYKLQRRKRLKSSDDILGLGAKFNSFESFDCFDEKKRFLECFGEEIAAGDSKFDLKTPKYVGNRLVFDTTEKMYPQCKEYLNSFKFDYLIHTIVYQSNIECKLNLSEEFEKEEIVEPHETEYHV